MRRLGLIRLFFAIPNQFSNLEHRIAFSLHKNCLAGIEISGYRAIFTAPTFIEFRRTVAMGSEKKVIEPFLDKIKEGDTVFDIGASVGLYTVFIAKKVGGDGRVVSFEPERQSRERLMGNIRLNSLGNVRVVSDALGRDESRQFLRPDKNFASGANIIFDAKENPGAAGGEEVSVFSGDTLIKKGVLPVPNAIKIDVEGMEDDVLTGLKETIRRPECRTVLCEIHFSNLEKRGRPEAPKRIEGMLKDSGFNQLFWLDRSHILAVK